MRPRVPRMDDEGRRRLQSDLLAVALVALLLGAVTFLPPDTTLSEVRRTGTLRTCLPTSYPPLVTGDSDRPGLDVEIMRAVADGLGVRFVPVTNVWIGRDFNPRNWRVTRAQCLVLAGGVVDAPTTRSFMVVTPPHLETGWAAVAKHPLPPSLHDVEVGFYAGLTGLERLGLSRWLRERSARVTVVSSVEEAQSGLESGQFELLVSEGLVARRIAELTSATAYWLPEPLGRVPIAFGLWKGDLTLERAVVDELRRLERDGTLAELKSKYALGPIEDECPFCD